MATTSVSSTCESLEAQIDDSVSVLGSTDTAEEGTTVTFLCPPGLVLDGTKSMTCMNGEWSMALHQINCSGSRIISCVKFGIYSISLMCMHAIPQ